MRLLRASRLVPLLIVVVLVLGYFWVFHWGGLERIVNGQLQSLVSAYPGLRISVHEVSGNLIDGAVLHGITVDWVREDRTVPLASIRELSAIYSLRDILSGRYEVEQIHLDSIRLRLDRDSSGALILPVPDRLDADNRLSEPSEAELPEFVVHSLSLTDVNAVLVGPTDTVRLEDLFLSLAVQGRDETISIDLRRFGAELPGENLDLNITGGRVTISPDQYVFADLSLQSGLTMIRLDGAVDTRDGTSATVRYGIDNFDLEMLARVMKTKLDGQVDVNGSLVLSDGSLSGTTSIGGRFLFADLDNLFVAFRYADRQLALDTLYGTAFGTCGLQGRGHIDFAAVPEEYSLAAAIKSFDLLSVVPGAFASRLTGLVDLRGRAFTNEELRLDIDVDVHESSFDDFALHAAAGSMVVTVDSILFPEPFHVGYYDNDFWVSGRVDYSDTMALDVRADLRDTRRFGPYFFIEEPAGRLLAEAKITGRTSDPDLVARAVSDSAWIYGLYADSLEANLDVARFLSRQEGWVDVRAWRGEAWSAPFDSLRSSLTIDNNLVGIDSVAIWTPEVNLAGAGELDYEASPMDLRLDSLTVTAYDKRFRCDGPIEVGIDSLGFDIRSLRLEDGRSGLAAKGWAGYDESMNLAVRAYDLPIGPWLSLVAPDYDVDGLLSASATLKGTRLQPQIELDATVDSLTYEGLVLGRLVTSVQYDDLVLTMDSVRVFSDPGEYRASGRLPVDLALTPDPLERLPNEPMDIDIVAKDSRFDLVMMLLPSVEQLTGQFSADLNLSGTFDDPLLLGDARLINGRLKYFDLAEPIYTDSAQITMRNNLIIVDSVTVYVKDPKKPKRRSKAFIDGTITALTLDTMQYDIKASIPQPFPFTYELDDIQGSVMGVVFVRGSGPPMVTGDLEIPMMRYRAEFTEAEAGSPIMAALMMESSWDLDINVSIPSNYFIQNSDINAEFEGDMNIKRRRGEYTFIGEMTVLRGRAYLADRTLTLESGGTAIFDGDEGLNPALDLVANTRVVSYNQSLTQGGSSAREDIDLCIVVSGTLEEPELDVCSGSDLAKEDILPLLLGNYYGGSDSLQTSNTLGDRLAGYVSGYVSNELSRLGARRLGVETFELDPYFSGGEFDPGQARLTVGAYAVPGLYVYGRSALSFESGQEIGFEARLSKALRLEGRGDENDEYRLGLKLHWEF